MKFRVTRHHEMVVDAENEEEARRKAYGMIPEQVAVEPLDIEALRNTRMELLNRWGRAATAAKDLDAQIGAIEQEIMGLQEKS